MDDIGIRKFQQRIEEIYFQRDSTRGLEGSALWFVEEVGELLRGLRRNESKEHLEGEFADVIAWLVTLGSIAGIDVATAALKKYRDGCPRCRQTPCNCP